VQLTSSSIHEEKSPIINDMDESTITFDMIDMYSEGQIHIAQSGGMSTLLHFYVIYVPTYNLLAKLLSTSTCLVCLHQTKNRSKYHHTQIITTTQKSNNNSKMNATIRTAGIYIPLLTGTLSVIGSSSILYSIWARRATKLKLKDPQHRILGMMSIFDILYSENKALTFLRILLDLAFLHLEMMPPVHCRDFLLNSLMLLGRTISY
jgi:hypothetical protein